VREAPATSPIIGMVTASSTRVGPHADHAERRRAMETLMIAALGLVTASVVLWAAFDDE
jgi:hypothetical protein